MKKYITKMIKMKAKANRCEYSVAFSVRKQHVSLTRRERDSKTIRRLGKKWKRRCIYIYIGFRKSLKLTEQHDTILKGGARNPPRSNVRTKYLKYPREYANVNRWPFNRVTEGSTNRSMVGRTQSSSSVDDTQYEDRGSFDACPRILAHVSRVFEERASSLQLDNYSFHVRESSESKS